MNIFKRDLLYVLCFVVGLVLSDCCFSLHFELHYFTQSLFVCVATKSDCLSALCCLKVMFVCLHCVV